MNLEPWEFPVPIVAAAGWLSVAGDPQAKAWLTDDDTGDLAGRSDIGAERAVARVDVQSPAIAGATGALGSARAFRHGGLYYKGVGRTQLAAHWTSPELYHSSGHMFPSSAAREYLVTRYLEDIGLDDAIVPCRDVLVTPLVPQIRRIVDSSPEASVLAPADRRLQCITVKPGAFARPSNYAWAFRAIGPSPSRVASLLASLVTALGGPRDADALADIGPRYCGQRVRALAQVVWRRTASFAAAGVLWNNTRNQLTVDGRVVDLETPTILGPVAEDPASSVWIARSWLGRELGFHDALDDMWGLREDFVLGWRSVSSAMRIAASVLPGGAPRAFLREAAGHIDEAVAELALPAPHDPSLPRRSAGDVALARSEPFGDQVLLGGLAPTPRAAGWNVHVARVDACDRVGRFAELLADIPSPIEARP